MKDFDVWGRVRAVSILAFLICVFGRAALAHAPAAAPADILAANRDTSVNPAVDFFDYANGGWLKKNPIPSTESEWGIGDIVQEEIYAKLQKINEDASKSNAPHGSEMQKVGDFWAAAMDEGLPDRVGLAPLKSELDRIASIRDLRGVIEAAFAEQPLRIGVFFNLYAAQDARASDVIAVQLDQGGLGLPDRDFYFNTDENSIHVRGEYVKHLQKMLDMVNDPSAKRAEASAGIMKFETALAKVSRKLEDLRDPVKNYNKMATADVTKNLTPSIDWSAQLARLDLAGATTMIVGQPEVFTALEALLKTTPIDDLKDYLRFRLVSSYARYLGKDFEQANFAFYGTVLNGQPEERPRWKRVLDAEERAMGMVLGKVFVAEYFPEATKKRYVNLVEAIRDAYRERISRVAWMSDATRQKAFEKLSKITEKVGYPDKWKDYSELEVGRDSWAQNMMNAARWRFRDMVRKFGKPVDRAEWGMTPQTYNAYYNPSNNEIVLPAAIFTIPGVLDSAADDAMVYGYAAASTIGHEITHGFDDKGRQFDAAGNLQEWWTKEDETRFKERAQVMAKQFDAYEPLPGMHINGKASLGENIADLGGILLGLDAFKKTEQYRKGEKISGLTPVQRYFLGYALGWLTEERRESLAQSLLSNVHAPAKWRVNGPFSNVPDFYDAFDVKPGDPLWRPEKDRVSIW